MRKMFVAALLSIVPCFSWASGGIFVGGGFYSAGQFMEMQEYQRVSVVASMVTMLNASGMAGSPDNYQRKLQACLERVEAKQLSAALANYLTSTPEQWDSSLGVPVVIMLDGFCEKRGIPLNRNAMFPQ